MSNLERRQFAMQGLKLEQREKEPARMVGHAAVFNTWTEIGGYFREQIRPGAFKRAIQEDDVRALFNHDPNFVLGRNKAGTLLLEEDETGLAIQIFPPETHFARDLGVSMDRGDIDQMSFGFRTIKDEWNYEARIPERTLLEVELFDISPVTFPAYPTTDVGMRAIEAYRKQQPAGGLTTVNAAAIVRSLKQRARANGY
jgi:HK97 family phage prohead protease